MGSNRTGQQTTAAQKPSLEIDEETSYPEYDINDEPEWHFLLRDPALVLGFDDLLANPPLEPAAPRIEFMDNGSDFFAKLPSELLDEILVQLPSTSVRNLELDSRKMASVNLSSKYWRSRFEFPNELCHVRLPEALLTPGWVENRRVDWRWFCGKVLHAVGGKFDWLRNRKRIIGLNRKLVQSMERRGRDGRLMDVDDKD